MSMPERLKEVIKNEGRQTRYYIDLILILNFKYIKI